ncbi:hypothetical protein [Vreelandella venusta]|uniref:Uncharacterized protein n=1 Tax=Vreelandella venusta TaxID=44935 RepID=A0AAP9ZAE9_9GAMM|nr:hypothetical protein [Halomonas venusta]QRL01738.1 hypothetical protein JDS37_10395 [Halomonas venusta]UQI38931.1 hypothetical protein M3L73_11855 [Halomonas venusta]WAM47084.1 hypothetical protein L0521_09845 [Halomonas venusta]WAM50594.1 hypothetical protein L0520_09825 [Halomonas venusta]GEK51085.1 hypothetical protein HVE01_18060 [Halomonas venusta]
MQQAVRRWLTGAIVGVSIVTLSGCGTLFHPERKGQLSGNVDPVVAIANGVGLLFFIVPGVIAYAVDFSNGTIYLPSASSASVDIHHLDDAMDVASLEKLLSDKVGQPISLANELLMMEEVASLDEALAMVRMSGVLDEERLATM